MHNRKVVKVLTLDDFDLDSKTVFLRMDMNCPIDPQTGEIIIPFDTNNNSTRLSSDSEGMYFKLYMDGLLVGRSYKIEFLIKDFDSDLLLNDILSNFTIHN